MDRSSRHDVVVLCWGDPTDSDRNARNIAAFLGVEATTVTLSAESLADRQSARAMVPRCRTLVVRAETLARVSEAAPDFAAALDAAEHVFVYGFEPTDRHATILRGLSSGALLGVQSLPDSARLFHVADGHRQWCGQLSGLSVATDTAGAFGFIEGEGERTSDVLILAGEAPFLVHAPASSPHVLLSAARELADLDEQVGRGDRPMSWFSRLVPLMMFLRGALGPRVWRNDHPRACLIIDDPLLKARHGFLKYQELIESMSRCAYSACIAFIPWNYRRSNPRVAALLSSNDNMPSLCVHGCDHTWGEFAADDLHTLRETAQLAIERMRAHERLSGVPFGEVMVFPQGLFSAAALTALKASGYLAAVNTDLLPVDGKNEPLALRDLLDVAIMRFDGFPLFGRRYPRDVADFAFDLFLGKPALAVEHHGYFRQGFRHLESFVAQLKRIDSRLEWTDLATICSRACLEHTGQDGEIHVRFYTRRFTLTNTGADTQTYVLFRSAPDGRAPAATVDGLLVSCRQDGGHLTLRLSLAAGQTAQIAVLPDDSPSIDTASRKSRGHDLAVLVRRRFCEFRDNYLDTSPILGPVLGGVRTVARTARRRAAERSRRPERDLMRSTFQGVRA